MLETSIPLTFQSKIEFELVFELVFSLLRKKANLDLQFATVSSLAATRRRLLRRRTCAAVNSPSPMGKRKSSKSRSPLKGGGSATSSKKTILPNCGLSETLDNHINETLAQDAEAVSPVSQELEASSHEPTSSLKSDDVPVIAAEADPDMTKLPSQALEIAVLADPGNTNQSTIETPKSTMENAPITLVIAETANPVIANDTGKESTPVLQKTLPPPASLPPSTGHAIPSKTPDSYSSRVRGSKQLQKHGEAYTLPSGETCVKMPNSIIEKHKKSWDCFVLGQFYSDPPSQGTIHNIANGIWSKQFRDISVTKMEGFAYLFRIPNFATRTRVINQRLWQIEGQTMFVAKWEPGIIPAKPELTAAPIWLELRNVPFQFFNEDGLERIASQVGDPKFLHPATANKTNLEVAKVFTIIDPRKPLPEAVNVQFENGEISRVLVSSPWMPPVCTLCKEIGHGSRRCKLAPITCAPCKSTTHGPHNCPKAKPSGPKGRRTRRAKSKDKLEVKPQEKQWAIVNSRPQLPPVVQSDSKLGTASDFVVGETSNSALPPALPVDMQKPVGALGNPAGAGSGVSSAAEPDSSDIESSDEEEEEGEEGEIREFEEDFTLVRKKQFKGLRNSRSKGSKTA